MVLFVEFGSCDVACTAQSHDEDEKIVLVDMPSVGTARMQNVMPVTSAAWLCVDYLCHMLCQSLQPMITKFLGQVPDFVHVESTIIVDQCLPSNFSDLRACHIATALMPCYSCCTTTQVNNPLLLSFLAFADCRRRRPCVFSSEFHRQHWSTLHSRCLPCNRRCNLAGEHSISKIATVETDLSTNFPACQFALPHQAIDRSSTHVQELGCFQYVVKSLIHRNPFLSL